jgi:GDP-D-mannose dehydratase
MIVDDQTFDRIEATANQKMLDGEQIRIPDAYNIFACSGILFNHESPLRPERFVTQKIVRAASRIAKGAPEKLALGNTEIQRDWGLGS